MIRRGINTILALSASGLLLTLVWYTAVGMAMGVPPKSRAYVGYPLGETYHTPDCRFIKANDPKHPVVWFTGADQIAASGRRPGSCCLSEPTKRQRSMSQRFQASSLEGNRLGQAQAD